ncbi:hypothetical protein GCM10025789_00930 [Tessaracoccus lubricantis]|uniref:DUF4041 domain-containing protein n=1 Tax=Tessaracoccus lubricantis TaxID=545543 RepID=A0ABP9EY71_9ACTN
MLAALHSIDGMFVAPGGAAPGFALSDAKGVSADRLQGAVDSLEAAAEWAIAADERDSTSWWDEFLQVVEHGFDYLRDKREFEARCAELVASLRRAVREVRENMRAVRESAGHVPDELEANAAQWLEEAGRVEAVRNRISGLRQISGWVSTASHSYTARSIVQDGATQELGGMASSMAKAISHIALFNRALFLVMYREIQATTQAIRRLQPGAKGYHYRRVANALQLLDDLRRNLRNAQVGRPVRDSSAELGGQVAQCLSSPQLLQPGTWPSGGAQASVPPAPTDSVPDPDEAESLVDDPVGPQGAGQEQDGVER